MRLNKPFLGIHIPVYLYFELLESAYYLEATSQVVANIDQTNLAHWRRSETCAIFNSQEYCSLWLPFYWHGLQTHASGRSIGSFMREAFKKTTIQKM